MAEDYSDIVDAKGKLISCKNCGYPISKQNTSCGKCGAKRPFDLRRLFMFMGFLLLIFFSCCISGILFLPDSSPSNINSKRSASTSKDSQVVSDAWMRTRSEQLVRLFLADDANTSASIRIDSIEPDGPLVWVGGKCIIGSDVIRWSITFHNDGRINNFYFDSILFIGIKQNGLTYNESAADLSKYKQYITSPTRDQLLAIGIDAK